MNFKNSRTNFSKSKTSCQNNIIKYLCTFIRIIHTYIQYTQLGLQGSSRFYFVTILATNSYSAFVNVEIIFREKKLIIFPYRFLFLWVSTQNSIRFNRFYVYWIQTGRHKNKQSIFKEKDIVIRIYFCKKKSIISLNYKNRQN